MKDTESFLESAGETAEYIKQYVKLQLDYLRLETAEKLAKTLSSLVAALAIGALGLMALLMLTLAAGFYLGERLHSFALAFVYIGGFYLFLALLVFLLKDRLLTTPLVTRIIRSFFG